MKTIDIHGKPYVMVKDRVIHFNKEYPNGCIRNKLIDRIDNIVIFEATVIPDIENPERYFTGHAEEEIGSSQINNTSALENCETSAVGRALAMMGIGSNESFASAEEVVNAKFQQKEAELTGMPLPSKTQGAPDKAKIGLKCHLCGKDMVDKRVWENGEWTRQTSPKGKKFPALQCIDNDDFVNPTCRGLMWDAPPDDLVKEENLAEAEEVASTMPLALQ